MFDLPRATETVWRQAGERYPIAAHVNRRAIEQYVLDDLGLSLAALDGDHEKLEDYLRALRRQIEVWFSALRAPVEQRATRSTAKPKLRSLERRLYLFGYVTERLRPTSTTSAGRVRRRVWQDLAEQWNRDHPADRTDAVTLARRYGYAKDDKNVQFNIEVSELLSAAEELFTSIGALREIVSRGTSETNALEAEGKITPDAATKRRVAARALAEHLSNRVSEIRESLSALGIPAHER